VRVSSHTSVIHADVESGCRLKRPAVAQPNRFVLSVPWKILTDVADGLQQSQRFLHAGGSTHVDWSLGSQSIHVLDLSLEDMLVEKENGVEALVLGARRYVMPTGQIGQELFQLFVTGECAGIWSMAAMYRRNQKT